MAIYIDGIRRYVKNGRVINRCHMVSSISLEELHEFAQKIGATKWQFHNDYWIPHYDLSPVKRRRAVENGAIETSSAGIIVKANNKVVIGMFGEKKGQIIIND